MNRRVALVVMSIAMPAVVSAQDAPPPTPYDQGRVSFGLSLGSQSSFGESYFAVGGRVGYYLVPGLELGFAGLKLFGGEPSVAMVSPELRYVMVFVPSSIKPFVGSFYRHWFVGDPFEDYDTIGGTVGAVWQQGGGLIFGLGVTHERVVSSCDEDAGDDCSYTYPAIIIAVSL